MGEGGDSQNSNLNQGILRHWLPDNLIPLAKKIFTFLNRGGGGGVCYSQLFILPSVIIIFKNCVTKKEKKGS